MIRILTIVAVLGLAACTFADDRSWLDTTLSDEARIEALLAAMTVEEKMGQLNHDAPAIERLGIPSYNWWNEALHGVARTGRATVFPQPIGLAATFDEDLILRMGKAISSEARAKFNVATAMGNRGQYAGLTFWSPNVNIFRDPRWGRGMETYGEDPFLQARLGGAFVRGLQGDNPARLKTAACAKHFAVHSGPEALRHEFDAVPPRRDLFETYLPAFEALADEGVECFMCAYNRVDGQPACGSDFLLQETLREQWSFKGHVVSDCWAIVDFYDHHKVSENAATASAWALKSGTDLNCGSAYGALPDALEQELITEDNVDTALRRLLGTKMKLGFFDPATPWDELGDEMVEADAHVALAREAAQKSVVMLKNENNILPLSPDLRTLYIVGPQADNTGVLYGNYNGLSKDAVTFVEGIVGRVSNGTSVRYRYGQLPYRKNVNPMDWVTGVAASSDATIVVLGVSNLIEGEEGAAVASPTKGDRVDLGLPQAQVDFLRLLRGNHDKPLIVVLTAGSPIATPEVYEMADAVLFAWYPGQQGGNAVADILFGDISPSGRLAITFPTSDEQLPPYEDYSMDGRTYKYMQDEPMYPFGFGLSYTHFAYENVELSAGRINPGESLDVSVEVRNTGEQAADEVVQLYLSANEAGFAVPQASLVGFQRVHLEPGASKSVRFTIAPEQMRVFDPDGAPQIAAGMHTVHVGGVSPGSRGEALTGTSLSTSQFEVSTTR